MEARDQIVIKWRWDEMIITPIRFDMPQTFKLPYCVCVYNKYVSYIHMIYLISFEAGSHYVALAGLELIM